MQPGTRLGPYEIVCPLGAGGMGEVWRARDTRLGREVAVKVLPDAVANDLKALSRFENEARAVAALSHPNILAIFDVGESGGVRFAVTELLHGQSLRLALAHGSIPIRHALDIAIQIVEALAAAHENGLVHRDVKPENVILGPDGHVKLVDFGLARHEGSRRAAADDCSPTVTDLFRAGAVAGTVAYMSPEQAKGQPVDYRTDQFSLGIVLYEMLAGMRPFQRGSVAETLTSIIREEPEALENAAPGVPIPVRWIVERCLAKEPGERYDSTRDLARELASCRAHLSEIASRPVERVPSLRPGRRALLFGVLSIVLVGASVGGTLFVAGSVIRRTQPKFQRLTFKRGSVTGARFTPDGRTVVYSAAWDGAPSAVYSVRLDSFDSVPSGYTGANLLTISAKSQIALSLQGRISYVWSPKGTLALAPFAGGTPREMDPDISFADFSRDGQKLALIRSTNLEYPSGTVLYRSTAVFLSHVRISPSGEHIAFLEHTKGGTNGGYVVAVDLSGKTILRKGPFYSLQGLTWSSRGDEIWFGGSLTDMRNDLRAVTLAGSERVVLAAPLSMMPHDVAPDGRVLASWFEHRVRIFCRRDVGSPERELSAEGESMLGPLSRDGSWVAFADDSVSGIWRCYLRSTSGYPLLSLGLGSPVSFAPDGRTLVVVQFQREVPSVVLHPVGAGPLTTIELQGFELRFQNKAAGLFPDGKRIWFRGNQPSRPVRTWEIGISGANARPLTPEGVSAEVTDDGLSLLFPRNGRFWIQPIAGGEARPVKGLLEGEWPAAWTPDGHPLFVYRIMESPARIHRLDPRTGKRAFFGEVGPADATGVQHVFPWVTPDGKVCAYQVMQWLSELQLIEGLR